MQHGRETKKIIQMRKIKYSFLLISTILLCAWMWLPKSFISKTHATSASNNISISASLTKDTFFVGESVPLTVKFKNVSGAVDSVALLNEDEVASRILVSDSNGQKSDYKGVYVSYTKVNYK